MKAGKYMKEKVNVTGVPETMVQTLYARAKETKKQNAKIKDEIAVELVEKLDYDFSKADKDKAMSCGVIARTIVLDRMVRQYLEKHENTVVINIACGLDTRCYRMKEKYLRWYNVDLPETMKIRRQFLPETGPIYQIAKSAMDDSYVDDIDYHGENVLVIIEGLTMYLCEKDIRKIFSIIEKSFQKVTVMVETMSPFVVKHMKEKSIEGSNAKFTWGVENGTELQKIVPNFSILHKSLPDKITRCQTDRQCNIFKIRSGSQSECSCSRCTDHSYLLIAMCF
jgi:O-methyltransferase involved in polyketide biosynthesis